ncbi:MAG: hypothetical protein A3B38_04260 [Candidatus Levybacteria bacterium RIFCSPLOWO2_01_FULL_36_13]|nr:MAG: hypothetical protein A2684_01185 [Candidatus Levybacteria bacterium RIFCSPHIGHO2_01_FULL_36_15b]OGH34340.1 MAG: hypothetical protein A3B38_04260 [Candidatus Levybacteria bacterium RIFCSPLOWO2_01_FULL_36_13]
MVKYYKKGNPKGRKNILRLLSFTSLIFGVSIFIYAFFPLISWQIYFAPVFANQEINAPIPKVSIVSGNTLASLISGASESLSGINYADAQNWFPGYNPKNGNLKTPIYNISIPKIGIENAEVSAKDTDLTKHLVNYGGTALPPERGNAVIFGHSTLPQLYNQKDYKTIFSYLFKLQTGDDIIVKVGNVIYNYKIESITVVDPTNTAVLEQNYGDSFLTLITCTPPGTIWKRLVVKARLTKI